MDRYPITLGVTLKSAQKKKASGAGIVSSVMPSPMGRHLTEELKQKVFARDKNTCRCCGFQSEKYQQILFRDGNFFNVKGSNLLTACIFCHQCFHIDIVNDMKSGVLLWLPEIEQWKLHHIARSIYVARISQGPVAEASRKALDVLMTRREEAKKRLTTDDPHIIATVLSDYLLPGHYKMRAKKLEGLRLFPLDRRIIKEADLEFNQFPQILAYWRSKNGPLGGKTPPQWIELYQDIISSDAA